MTKVLKVPALSRKRIESFTAGLLRSVDPDGYEGKSPVDIETIYEFYVPEELNVEVEYCDLTRLGPNVLGFTYALDRKSFISDQLIDAVDIPTIRRCRATIGHEIGHCFLHVPVLSEFTSSSTDNEGWYRANRQDIKPYLDPEWQAWEFARALLMPRHLIVEYWNQNLSMEEIAKQFDLNPAFVEVRLKTLKLI